MELTTRGTKRKQFQTGKAGTNALPALLFRYARKEELKKLAFAKGLSVNSLITEMCNEALEKEKATKL